jgi:hypothetical protein
MEKTMNVDNGHLVREKMLAEMKEEARENYERVPERLTLSAKLELMGKDETVVGKEATSQIAEWARSKRNRLERKVRKRKMNKVHCK